MMNTESPIQPNSFSVPSSSGPVQSRVLSVEKQGMSLSTKLLIGFLSLVAVTFGVLYTLSLLPGSTLQTLIPGMSDLQTNTGSEEQMNVEMDKESMGSEAQSDQESLKKTVTLPPISSLKGYPVDQYEFFGSGSIGFYIARYQNKLYGYMRVLIPEEDQDRVQLLMLSPDITNNSSTSGPVFQQLIATRQLKGYPDVAPISEWYQTPGPTNPNSTDTEIPEGVEWVDIVTEYDLEVPESETNRMRVNARITEFATSPSGNTMFYSMQAGTAVVNSNYPGGISSGSWIQSWYIKRTADGFSSHLIPIPQSSSRFESYLYGFIVSPDENSFMTRVVPCLECGGGITNSYVYSFTDTGFTHKNIGFVSDFEWIDNQRFRYKLREKTDCTPDDVDNEGPMGCYLDPAQLEFIEDSM